MSLPAKTRITTHCSDALMAAGEGGAWWLLPGFSEKPFEGAKVGSRAALRGLVPPSCPTSWASRALLGYTMWTCVACPGE